MQSYLPEILFQVLSKPLVHVNNLEIKLSIIHTIQHNQFGAVAEDPYTHFAKFIQIVTPLN